MRCFQTASDTNDVGRILESDIVGRCGKFGQIVGYEYPTYNHYFDLVVKSKITNNKRELKWKRN